MPPTSLDPQLLAGHWFRLWQGMAREWLGLWSPLLPGIEGLVAGLPSASSRGPAAPPSAPATSAGWSFEASRPMRVSLRLFRPESGVLTAKLHGGEPSQGVTVELSATEPTLALPGHLPPGRYEGVVSNAAGALVGALSVVLFDPGEPG